LTALRQIGYTANRRLLTVHDHLLRIGLAKPLNPVPTQLCKATSVYQTALDDLTHRAGVAT
jgi:hypothetical protein